MPESPASRRPSSPEVANRVEWFAGTYGIMTEKGLRENLDFILDLQHAASVAATEARLAGMAPTISRLMDELDDAYIFLHGATRNDVRVQADKDILALTTKIVCAFAAQSAALRASEEANLALREALEKVNYELAALVADPATPDFMDALGKRNIADAQCLTMALWAARSALGKEWNL